MVTNTHRNYGDLLTWILTAYGLELGNRDNVSMHHRLLDFVANEHKAGRRVVLVVDEAQNMDAETLEELRLLSNMNVGEELLLQLVLVGQPELQDTIALPGMLQFAQRISAEHHITPLDYEGTENYIRHRIAVAGSSEELFDRYARGHLLLQPRHPARDQQHLRYGARLRLRRGGEAGQLRAGAGGDPQPPDHPPPVREHAARRGRPAPARPGARDQGYRPRRAAVGAGHARDRTWRACTTHRRGRGPLLQGLYCDGSG
ncbi:MAG: AAA family ATPase [Gammaproteobacteria bacterium]|nr:AAA family ATPase [Gammaproteobacteria bacterium]